MKRWTMVGLKVFERDSEGEERYRIVDGCNAKSSDRDIESSTVINRIRIRSA